MCGRCWFQYREVGVAGEAALDGDWGLSLLSLCVYKAAVLDNVGAVLCSAHPDILAAVTCIGGMRLFWFYVRFVNSLPIF